MKILFVSPYLPHPRCGHGAGVFIYGMIEKLMTNHDVSLISFCDKRELELSKDFEQLPVECVFIPRGKGARKNFFWNAYLVAVRSLQLLRSILLWQPYYVAKFHHPRMVRELRSLTSRQQFDIVQIEFSQMGQYAKHVLSGKTVLHEIDVSFRPSYRKYRNSKSPFHKAVAYIEWCRWAKYEPVLVDIFDHVLTLSDQDRLLLNWLKPGRKNISYFPLAVDVAREIPAPASRDRQTLLFVGTFSHYPNVDAVRWLCSKIFPLVLRRFPQATLSIVGPHPPADLLDIAASDSRIRVLGFVDDVNVYLRRCSVFVAPIRFGGGVKTKVLGALAQGIPVVSTKIGVEGIDGVESDAILVDNSPEGIANHICDLFEHPERAAMVGERGWNVVESTYSWDRIIARLLTIYQSILTESNGRPRS